MLEVKIYEEWSAGIVALMTKTYNIHYCINLTFNDPLRRVMSIVDNMKYFPTNSS